MNKFSKLGALIIFGFFTAVVAGSLFVYRSILPYYFAYQWEPGENFESMGEYDQTDEVGEFLGNEVRSVEEPSNIELAETSDVVLGKKSSGEKRIEVDLTKQKTYAFEGNKKVMEFTISSGKWGRTPTGEFTIGYKTRSQTMKGGSKKLGTYYYLPNVQYVQFFGNSSIPWSKGYAFHGAYWHNNFGQPMSHGCINMRNEDAKKLYEWAKPSMGDKKALRSTAENPGTRVVIYGKAPR